jgi:hypothetical protein
MAASQESTSWFARSPRGPLLATLAPEGWARITQKE